MFGPKKKFSLLAGILILFFSSHITAQDVSATATSVRGTVSATNDDGTTRNITRGEEIYSGELIETSSRSRIRMAFTDGGTYVLKENTSFEIDEYQFSGQEDGTEKAVFSLLKGTVEALSGLIGKSNNENFRLDTPLSAIGLRGTEFTVSVIQPENPGDPVRVQLSVIGGIVTYQSTVTIPGTPPPQLLDVYQGNSVEQLENTLPQEISSIIVPLLTMTPEGDEVEDVIEEEYDDESSNGDESSDDNESSEEQSDETNDDQVSTDNLVEDNEEQSGPANSQASEQGQLSSENANNQDSGNSRDAPGNSNNQSNGNADNAPGNSNNQSNSNADSAPANSNSQSNGNSNNTPGNSNNSGNNNQSNANNGNTNNPSNLNQNTGNTNNPNTNNGQSNNQGNSGGGGFDEDLADCLNQNSANCNDSDPNRNDNRGENGNSGGNGNGAPVVSSSSTVTNAEFH